MRGSDAAAGSLFSYVDLEKRVPADHPPRVIREIVNATLAAMPAEFDALYSPFGRESIPLERLPRALLLQAFHGIRSERQMVERLDFDLLFRWFAGLGWTIRYGTRPPSPRTATGCWEARSRPSSSPVSWRSPR